MNSEPTNRDAYLAQFDPHRNTDERVIEEPLAYAARMQRSLLPHWPTDILVDWLHWHERHIYQYASLGFENLHFRLETWSLERIPGAEAFRDPNFIKDCGSIEAQIKAGGWLVKYMVEHGTWKTPIILLDTRGVPKVATSKQPLRFPVHLLEGHHRLAFLNLLRDQPGTRPEHKVWIAEFRAKS